jgi:hypothetical protein
MAKSKAHARYSAMKEELSALGFVRPGSLVRRFMACGKPSCCCKEKPPKLHGPYYQWSYKVLGKTVSMRLTEEQARMCIEWAANHRTFKKLVRQMEALSLKETDSLLRKTRKT